MKKRLKNLCLKTKNAAKTVHAWLKVSLKGFFVTSAYYIAFLSIFVAVMALILGLVYGVNLLLIAWVMLISPFIAASVLLYSPAIFIKTIIEVAVFCTVYNRVIKPVTDPSEVLARFVYAYGDIVDKKTGEVIAV